MQVGELEGRLAAAEAVRAELEAAKKTIGSLQGKSASDDARLLELLESQKLNSQHVAVAMGHAQQHAASEYERLQAEHAAQHQATATQAQYFRQRADRANSRCGAPPPRSPPRLVARVAALAARLGDVDGGPR